MLNEVSENEAVNVFERGLKTFEQIADINTGKMYEEIYKKIIEDYKTEPMRGAYGGYCGYSVRLNITEVSFSKYDTNSKTTYLNVKGDLAETHNNRREDKIYFYTSIDPNNKIVELTFNFKLLANMLKEDGFNVELPTTSSLYAYIDTNKFRELINSSKPYKYVKK